MENFTGLIARMFKSLAGNVPLPCSKGTTAGRFARTSLLLLFVLCCGMVSAEQVQVTLTTAGTLSEKIASDQKYTITSLKVSGPINGTDVRYLREMAGKDYEGNSTDGQLVELDLSGASIVYGGENYYSSYCTENDVLGSFTFMYCKLTSIKIPNSVTSIGDLAFYYCSYGACAFPHCGVRFFLHFCPFSPARGRVKYEKDSLRAMTTTRNGGKS